MDERIVEAVHTFLDLFRCPEPVEELRVASFGPGLESMSSSSVSVVIMGRPQP